jgi:ABC-type sugar transport system substrate-binding protein
LGTERFGKGTHCFLQPPDAFRQIPIDSWVGSELIEVLFAETECLQDSRCDGANGLRLSLQPILQDTDDLAGIICCNMSNPVGAARAVAESGRDIVIVGMDHDREALHFLKDGVIYCLGVQDCYSIGFDTLQVAVKIADGVLPGTVYPEKTEERTTIIYQKDAETILEMLYGEIQ